MSIIRVNKTNKYSVISNEPLSDERLSWAARGVMAYLLTKPDDWVVRNKDLENSGGVGKKKIKRIIKELKDAGYIKRHRERQEDGTFLWITDVYESPALNPAYGGNSKENPSIYPKGDYGTIVPKPSYGEPPHGEGDHIVSTESPNTDLINTESSTTTTIDTNSGAFKTAVSLGESLAKDNPRNWAYKGFQNGWIWDYVEMRGLKPRNYKEGEYADFFGDTDE
jgi:hypothetical protein